MQPYRPSFHALAAFHLYLCSISMLYLNNQKCVGDIVFEVRSRSICSDVVSLSCQASLNSSMDSLKAELNTALQCDRESEDEAKNLKVSASKIKISGYLCAHAAITSAFPAPLYTLCPIYNLILIGRNTSAKQI